MTDSTRTTDRLRGLTLTQPWATLIAIGAKRWETRGWPTGYRGPIAIHAAKGLAGFDDEGEWGRLLYDEPFRQALFGDAWPTPQDARASLPRGAIVAVATLEDVLPTDNVRHYLSGALPWPTTGERDSDLRELSFGNYENGRFAWRLTDVQRLPEPIPCRGALSLWHVPGDVDGLVLEAIGALT